MPGDSPLDRQWVLTAPRSGQTFLVAGISVRQDALAQNGAGRHLFTLVREPDNTFDANAVQVFSGGLHIGYISSTYSAAWSLLLEPFQRLFCTVNVHGTIEQRSNGYKAVIDAPAPQDWLALG